MLMTQRRAEFGLEFFELDDCVISYDPMSMSWNGTWKDGLEMGEGVALSVAVVERLAWPDGQIKADGR